MKYLCKFRYETWDEANSITSYFDHYDVASDFAEDAYDNRDMWEHSDRWEDDHLVDVMDEEKNIKSFIINVEFAPNFTPEEFKINL